MRKYFKILIFIILLFLVSLSAFIFIVPKLINLDSFKSTIINQLGAETGGDIKIERIDLSYFPTLKFVVRNLSFEIERDSKFTGVLDQVSIQPKIIQLIQGKIKIKKIAINSPTISVIAKYNLETVKTNEDAETSLIEIFERNIKSFARLSYKYEGIIIMIKNGSLNLAINENAVFGFNTISAYYKSNKQIVNLVISSNASFSQHLNIKGSLDIDSSIFSGLIQLKKAEPHLITRYFYTGSQYKLKDSDVDVIIELNPYNFNSDLANNIDGNISGRLNKLILANADRELTLIGRNYKGSFFLDRIEQKISVSEVNIDEPKLIFNGELSLTNSPKSINLMVGGKDFDIGPLRKLALSFLGETGRTGKILNIVRGGHIEWISISSKAASINMLFKGGNYKITGRMNNGEVYIPKVDWTISNVYGDAEIFDQVLHGKNLKGKHTNTFAYNGKLKLGLTKNRDILKLDTNIKGDIKRLPAYLRQFIKDKKFINEMSLVNDIKGSANGRLFLGDKKSLIDLRFDVSDINLQANYQRVPYTIILQDGSISYENSRIEAKNVSGNVSKSIFSNLSLNYDWSNDKFLEITSMESDLSLDEFYPWLLSFEKLNIYLKRTKISQGVLNIYGLRFKGDPLNPSEWQIQIKGKGDISKEINTKIAFELEKKHDEIYIKNFQLNDKYSDLVMKFKYKKRLHEFAFAGNLSGTTLNNLIECNDDFDGYMGGELSINLIKDSLFANGNLEGQYMHCGIYVKCNIEGKNQFIGIDLKLNNEEEEIGNTIGCLSNKESPITGKYKFNIDIKSEENGNNLKDFFQGTYSFTSKDGSLSRKENLVFKILSILNISTLFKGKIGTLADKNVTYTEINSDGKIRDGRFIIDNAHMYGPSTGVLVNGYVDPIDRHFDVHIKATPLESIDYFMRIIPLLKKIQTKNFIFIPIHVQGNIGNPDVSILDE